MNTAIKSSELIVNPDGTIFHLHLKPDEIADTIILVGDPGRVESISSRFDNIEFKRSNREFFTVTGNYRNKRLSVISTGIGTDNIDIVVNELDALANIDLKSRKIKATKRSLNLIRVGTSGSLQQDIPIGSYVISEKSIGLDGVLRFYKGNKAVCDSELEDRFISHCHWIPDVARPYAVSSSPLLIDLLHTEGKTVKGVTLTANGFYAPQGRELRLPLSMKDMNNHIASFRYNEHRIANFEMESAAIAGLSAMMGHNAITVCLIIANRLNGDALPDYKKDMEALIGYILEKLVTL